MVFSYLYCCYNCLISRNGLLLFQSLSCVILLLQRLLVY